MKKTTEKTRLFITRHAAVFSALALAALTFLVFLPALGGEFVIWDDNHLITDNPRIRSLDLAFVKWAFTSVLITTWYPLTLVSFALDYALWGLDPWGFHLTNIVLHSANAFLVAIIIYRLVTTGQTARERNITDGVSRNAVTDGFNKSAVTDGLNKGAVADGFNKGALAVALVTALLFALHPLRVESVAWVTERKDVLYAFFYLLSVLAYLSYAAKDARRKALFYTGSVMLFAASLMSKPMAVTLPVVLIILDFYPLGRLDIKNGWRGARSILLEKAPFLILALTVSIAAISTHHHGRFIMDSGTHPLVERLLVSAYNYIFYLYKMLAPTELPPIYPYPEVVSLFTLKYSATLLVFVAATVYAVLSIKKQKVFAAAWFYYIVTLLPVSGIISIAGDASAAGRYTYLACLGPMLMVGLLAGSAFDVSRKKSSQTLTVALVIIVASVLSFMTVKQTKVWKDTITLWSYQISVYPGRAPVAYNNLGLAYANQGRKVEAIRQYKKALDISPEIAVVRYNLAIIYGTLGLYDEAITEYSEAIRIHPYYPVAINNLGNAYQKTGRLEEAARQYEAALAIDPGFFDARFNLAVAREKLGQTDEAITDYKRALEAHPDHAMALNMLANAYFKKGRLNDARREYEKALAVEPDHLKTRYNLAVTYHRLGLLDQAVSAYQEVLKRLPDFADAHFNLALAYKNQGKTDEAKRELEETLKINPDHQGARQTLRALK